MTEKKYLNLFNKIGYGVGDVAGNVVYSLVTVFSMIYLTDTVGLNSGIVGTLMAVSRLFDCITAFFFGSMIDRTRSKMGRARPWMLWPYVGNVICLIACFSVPMGWGETAQYVFFFIAYTMLNSVFFAANNIAYCALTPLITKNKNEQVQLGSFRFLFAFATSLLIQGVTVGGVELLGGGAEGWRWVAVIYSLVGLACNTFSVFSVRELPQSELEREGRTGDGGEKTSFGQTVKLLFENRFFLPIILIYLATNITGGLTGVSIYFMTYVMKDAELLGSFALWSNIPTMLCLLVVPVLIEKAKGMYRVNVAGYAFATVCRGMVIVGAAVGSVPIMLVFTGLAYVGMSPFQGDLNALVASCCEHTYLSKGVRVDGVLFSCTSLGSKLGLGLGNILGGWLLDVGGYVPNAVEQSASALNMLNFMYLWLPALVSVAVTLLLAVLNVEKANRELMEKRK
jgi:GPH family glycoside/pentoside/hexuronide:cation symporter